MKTIKLITTLKNYSFILLLFACKNVSNVHQDTDQVVCKNSNNHNTIGKISIQFVDFFDTITIIAIDCDKFELAFKDELIKRTICDSVKIRQLNDIIKGLEPIDSTRCCYIDARAKIEIDLPTDTTRLCIGLLTLEKDGVFYETPPELVQFIENLR